MFFLLYVTEIFHIAIDDANIDIRLRYIYNISWPLSTTRVAATVGTC